MHPMNNYRRPSQKALLTFESATRHKSFKEAATRLQTPGDLPNITLIHIERNLIAWKIRIAERSISIDKVLSFRVKMPI